jgi:hypothetical protein
MNTFKPISLKFLIVIIFIIGGVSFLPAADDQPLQEIKANFLTPPMDCRPHTYWWWPGNAVTEEEITWELEQMQTHGMGGVLITSAAPEVYEKGNIPFLSDEHIKMLDHAVREAKRLKMEVNLNFAPGWVFGGYWVPPEERAQSLVPVYLDLHGPTQFNSELPKFAKATDRRFELSIDNIPEVGKLVAVIAGKVNDNTIESSSLIELSSRVSDNILTWEVPEGTWRLMVFWLKHTGQIGMYVKDTSVRHWCVDHFSKSAMRNYCNFLGDKYYSAFGDEFGKTVEALHCDSWELANLPNGIYWSDSLMIKFRQSKGYDLTKYLPAIWWEVGEISPRIRYDVNEFLHEIGLETHFKTFLGWCASHGVKGSMEAIGYPMDILKGSGMAHLPMNEVTPGEKDGVPWFDTRIGVKKYVTSGAHIYNRNVVGVEAYTFIHWELYRATLEDLKIASDGFLRSGANKFYNHGYSYSAERNPTPSRSIPFAARISPVNIWWKYYPLLADYVGRCSYLLRQGEFAPDIAVYSPLANQWTLNVLNARKWTREFYWGELGKLLVANGYDFDLLNDEALQTMARIEDGHIKIRNLAYKILILPNIKSLPLETLLFIQNYVKKGGTVIALENVPGSSVGFDNYINEDDKVKSVINEMFSKSSSTKPKIFGKGRTFFMKWVINRQDVLDWQSSALDPFVNALRAHCQPDFGIDFMHEGLRENNGLSFLHRKSKQMDIYFVSNIQDKTSAIPVTFRIKDKIPRAWNPYNGEISPLHYYIEKKEGIEIPLNLAPYESIFIVFQDDINNGHVEYSNFYQITDVTENKVKALASENGSYFVTCNRNNANITKSIMVKDIPAPFVINGKWRLKLKGLDFDDFDTSDFRLMSWTQKKPMQYYSGTGRYDINFNLPVEYISDNLRLLLDLGKVGNVAEVELNDTPVGIIWMRGQTLDISKATKVGENQLTVFVTNTLINRVSGMQKAPPVPANLVSHYGNGMTDYSSGRQKTVEMGFQPLPPSGLMGPVKIKVLKKVSIDIN